MGQSERIARIDSKFRHPSFSAMLEFTKIISQPEMADLENDSEWIIIEVEG